MEVDDGQMGLCSRDVSGFEGYERATVEEGMEVDEVTGFIFVGGEFGGPGVVSEDLMLIRSVIRSDAGPLRGMRPGLIDMGAFAAGERGPRSG